MCASLKEFSLFPHDAAFRCDYEYESSCSCGGIARKTPAGVRLSKQDKEGSRCGPKRTNASCQMDRPLAQRFASHTNTVSKKSAPITHTTMKSSIVCLLGILEASFAFQPVQNQQARERIQAMKNEDDTHDIVVASSTFRDIDLDIDRVKDCAEHFGKCSVEELKELKSGKHQCCYCERSNRGILVPDRILVTTFQICTTNAFRAWSLVTLVPQRTYLKKKCLKMRFLYS